VAQSILGPTPYSLRLNALVHAGDRDECLDDRAATVLAAGARRPGAGGGERDVTFRLGLDESAQGWRYRGRVFKAGVTFPFTTDRYMLEGTVLSVDWSSDGGAR
jgi:hypothetical protein